MKERGSWQGMLSIARFNWPFYVAGAVGLLLAVAGMIFASNWLLWILSAAAGAGALYFLVGSLGVSHVIYDRSDLYRWQWLDRALGSATLQRAIFCHAGFDETSDALRDRFPQTGWRVLDHFDSRQMTEASIRRARLLYPPTPGTIATPSDRWPVEDAWADSVFGLLAIHELRSDAARRAWLDEARRCLRADGRIVLVEHLRDLANFVAFGPGFLHFHSRATWQRNWQSAGLRLVDEFRVTPWVRVLVLVQS